MLKCQADVLLLPVVTNARQHVLFGDEIAKPQAPPLPSETSEKTDIIFMCRKKNFILDCIYPTGEDLNDETIFNLYKTIYNSFNSRCSHCEYNPQAMSNPNT